MFVSIIQS